MDCEDIVTTMIMDDFDLLVSSGALDPDDLCYFSIDGTADDVKVTEDNFNDPERYAKYKFLTYSHD